LITLLRMIDEIIEVVTDTLCRCFDAGRFVHSASLFVDEHVDGATTSTLTSTHQIGPNLDVLTTTINLQLVVVRVTAFDSVHFELVV